MHNHFGMFVAVFAGTWLYRLQWGGWFILTCFQQKNPKEFVL